MGIFRGPNIVTDELIFAIDAKSKRSYSGSGNSVNDISGTHPGGSLANGTTHVDDNFFHFDGGNDELSFPTNDVFERGTTPFTMEAWVRLNANTGTSNLSMVMGGGNPLCDGCDGGFMILYSGEWNLNVRFDNVGLGNMDSITYSKPSTFIDGTFHHIVGLRDGTNTKLYLDGTLVKTGTDSGTNVNDISTFFISGWSSYRGDMDVAISRIYSKALSDVEVLQNYNAQKERFI